MIANFLDGALLNHVRTPSDDFLPPDALRVLTMNEPADEAEQADATAPATPPETRA
jgi:hypothetical protein